MKKLFIAFFILTVVVPTTTHAYSEEQYRTDIKQYLDTQTKYQQQEQWRLEDQTLINNLRNGLTNNSLQYDTSVIQKQLEEKEKQYKTQSDQINQLLKQMDELNKRINSSEAARYVKIPTDCSTVIAGSILNESATACKCPSGTELSNTGDVYFCANTTKSTVTTKPKDEDKYSMLGLDKPETAVVNGKPAEKKPEVKKSEVVSATSTVPAPQQEQPKSFFRSFQDRVKSFFSWLF